jgi:hypothetical protein
MVELGQNLGKGPETLSPIEHIPVTVSGLLEDNQSELARNKVGIWFNNYETLGTYVVEGCADARPVNDPLRVIEQNSVAAGFPYKKGYVNLYNDPRTRGIVKQTHFAKIELGKRPNGCGGQDTMAKIRAGEIDPTEGITNFVAENVHEDPLVQSVFQAQQTSRLLRVDRANIFVVSQNHTRGLVYPIGEFRIFNKTESRVMPVQLRDVLAARDQKELQESYDPRAIYLDGIPEVPRTSLSDEFIEYLQMADQKMTELLRDNPDFSERQAVQNPQAFIISANKIPFQIRYPSHFGDFGTAFKVHIPRTKGEDQVVSIDQKTIKSALDQMQYGVEHSVANHDNSNKDFSRTHVMLIETGDYLQSLKIAEQIMAKPWMKKWIELPGHQLFVSETRGSRTLKIEEFAKPENSGS